MGYNLCTRCVTCGEAAFVLRGKEAQSIRLWYSRHSGHVIEWAVDNNKTAPAWVDTEAGNGVCLPDDLEEELP